MSRYARHHPDDEDLWDAPVVRAFPGKCKCSHPEASHGTDRKGRYGCFFAVCGCTTFRPQEGQ